MTAAFAAPIEAVDRLEADGSPGAVTAVKKIVPTDPYLAGHYPHLTIYPGVFSIETVYQAARAAVLRERPLGTRVELTAIRSVRFSAPLLPGDTLTAACLLTESSTDPDHVMVTARCLRADGRIAARIRLELAVGRADA